MDLKLNGVTSAITNGTWMYEKKRKDGYATFTERSLKTFHDNFEGYKCDRCDAFFVEKHLLFKHRAQWCKDKPDKPFDANQLDLFPKEEKDE